MIVNRVGDVSLILGFSLISSYTNNLNFAVLLSETHYLRHLSIILTLSSFLLLVAAIGKSAQFGLHI